MIATMCFDNAFFSRAQTPTHIFPSGRTSVPRHSTACPFHPFPAVIYFDAFDPPGYRLCSRPITDRSELVYVRASLPACVRARVREDGCGRQTCYFPVDQLFMKESKTSHLLVSQLCLMILLPLYLTTTKSEGKKRRKKKCLCDEIKGFFFPCGGGGQTYVGAGRGWVYQYKYMYYKAIGR